MKFLSQIGISGSLKLTIIDAFTKEIIRVDEGNNLVLNTGLQDLCYLLSGNIIVPSDLVSGAILNTTGKALPNVPFYGQFGTNGTTPSSTDPQVGYRYGNGTLDANASTPLNASEIIRATNYYSETNKVTFQFFLQPTQGNGPTEGFDRIYREAVLMSKTLDDPLEFRWFARRTFGDTIKNNSTIISAEWTFTFVAVRT
jgi:hypothetical protein